MNFPVIIGGGLKGMVVGKHIIGTVQQECLLWSRRLISCHNTRQPRHRHNATTQLLLKRRRKKRRDMFPVFYNTELVAFLATTVPYLSLLFYSYSLTATYAVYSCYIQWWWGNIFQNSIQPQADANVQASWFLSETTMWSLSCKVQTGQCSL